MYMMIIFLYSIVFVSQFLFLFVFLIDIVSIVSV